MIYCVLFVSWILAFHSFVNENQSAIAAGKCIIYTWLENLTFTSLLASKFYIYYGYRYQPLLCSFLFVFFLIEGHL